MKSSVISSHSRASEDVLPETKLPIAECSGSTVQEQPTMQARVADVSLRRHDSFESAEAWREEWDGLVERAGGDLFTSFDWCALWWRHFGHGRRLELQTAWRGDELVGVLPLFRETIRWGPIGLRVVRVIGCDHGVTTCNVAINPHCIESTTHRLMESLADYGRWDLIHLGELPGYAENTSSLAEALRGCPQVGEVLFCENEYPHNVFEVPPDYDSFLAGLSTKERRNVRRDERQLGQRPGAMANELHDHAGLHRAFDDLIALHRSQWTARGRLGHFADWPDVERFHRAVADSLLTHKRLAFVEIRAEGRVIASEYAGRFGRRVHWIIGGRDKEATSRIGFCSLMHNAIRDGDALIDALPGSYEYKRRLGAKTLEVKTITVLPEGNRGRWRLALVKTMTQLMSLAYHRVWFWHFAPWLRSKFPGLRLPLLQAGLWRRFVRARFLVAGRHDSVAEPALRIESGMTNTIVIPESNEVSSRPFRKSEVFRDPSAPTERTLVHSIHHNFDEVVYVQPEWDEFVERCGGDLFLTFDWCRIWWRHYGENRHLEIHLFRVGERLIGILPLFRETLRFGPMSARLIRLVGCDHSVTTCGFAIDSGWIREIVSSLVERITGGPAWDMIHLGPLPGYFIGSNAVARAFRAQRNIGFVSASTDDGPQIVFDLPESYDTYLAALTSRERNNIRSRKRKLEKTHSVIESLATGEDIPIWFDSFVAQHQRQWQAQNQLGHFRDWPESTEFHRELAMKLGELDRLRLLCLDVDGNPVGYQYNYRFGSRVHWVLGSRDHASYWDQYSLGRYLHCATVERSIAEGATQIDAMKGMYDYKVQLGGKVVGLQSISVVRRSTASAIRVCGVRLLARALHLIYYRIWFNRVGSRFPSLRRPLWRRWIRSRI